jgi:hypothetical protein
MIQGNGPLIETTKEDLFAHSTKLLKPSQEGVAVHHVDVIHLRIDSKH